MEKTSQQNPKPKKGIFRRIILPTFVALIVIAIAAEFYLRWYWGFCDSVLMMEHDKYEYIAQPNQDRFRFRNHIRYNSLSMRSEEPDSSAIIILGFGDSVINGSVMVDQDSVASTKLSVMLSEALGKKVQVLNISAGSWGPDNCYEYLKEHGDFNAKMVFLVASSHDAYDNINFQPVVNVERGFETHQYKLALWELTHRYLMPKLFSSNGNGSKPIKKNGTVFNSGFSDLNDYCTKKGIPFLVYLHPDSLELGRRKYNANGLLIEDFCNRNNIPVVSPMNINEQSDYRDIIHLQESGHRKMADKLFPVLFEDMKARKENKQPPIKQQNEH